MEIINRDKVWWSCDFTLSPAGQEQFTWGPLFCSPTVGVGVGICTGGASVTTFLGHWKQNTYEILIKWKCWSTGKWTAMISGATFWNYSPWAICFSALSTQNSYWAFDSQVHWVGHSRSPALHAWNRSKSSSSGGQTARARANNLMNPSH